MIVPPFSRVEKAVHSFKRLVTIDGAHALNKSLDAKRARVTNLHDDAPKSSRRIDLFAFTEIFRMNGPRAVGILNQGPLDRILVNVQAGHAPDDGISNDEGVAADRHLKLYTHTHLSFPFVIVITSQIFLTLSIASQTTQHQPPINAL